MNFYKDMLKLYAITPVDLWEMDEPLKKVEQALAGGVTMLQLREKGISHDEYCRRAEQILPVTTRYNVPLIINDSAQVAKAVGAQGVHIGQTDGGLKETRDLLGADSIIGITVRTMKQASAEDRFLADYAGSGAVFPTDTKLNTVHIGIPAFSEIVRAVGIPVVAIGGIDEHNIRELSGSGACGVSLISAVWNASNIEQQVRLMRREVDGWHA